MEIGISTFGEIPTDSIIGKGFLGNRRVQELLQEVKLADEVGLDLFAFGEHHRPDFVISAPEVIMGAAAAITKRIRLSNAVTVLSSADPVRAFENFATVDLISSGRAEIMVGRGAFTESFPLFGYDFADANELFDENLQLLLAVNKREFTSWQGKFRNPVPGMGIYPRPYQASLPVWFAVSRTAASVVKAADLGLPISVSMFGSTPEQFVPLVDLYRQNARKKGQPSEEMQIAIATQFYVQPDSGKAAKEFYPSYEKLMMRLAKERGLPAVTYEQFEFLRTKGPLVIGSAQEAVDKIMLFYELFGNTRYIAQIDAGYLPHQGIMKAIELLGTEIAPVIRKETAARMPVA